MNCDDNKIPADKSEFVSGNSKSSPHPLPDEAILHTHNQQTTHQITTVTKFIHEVKHINPDGSSIDDIASPTDRKYSKSDNTTICYSTMPMENNRCQHLGYSETDTPQSLNQCHSLCVADDSNLLARHCPTGAEYHNPLINHKNAMIVQSQGSYNCDDLMGAYHGRNEQCVSSSTLSQKVAASSFMPADAVQSADYLPRPQYDEMPNYIVTSSLNEAGHEAYTEDPSMLYGYISETNYAVPRSAVPVNLNSYTTLPLSFEVNINASEAELQKDKEHRIYDNSADIRNPMAHLSLHPHMGASQMLDPKDGYIRDVTNDAAATMRWRAPNLSEVISFLNNPSSTIKANAAAYLQHLCYMDDPNKQRTRTLGGIPPLVRLLSSDVYEVYKNACGALRNLSYGRQNDENKRAIKNAGGIAALINLLCRVKEVEVKELVTGVIWNMSSCEDLKRFIIDDGLSALVIKVIKPNSGWDPVCPGETCTSTVFRNASGVLRNVSSAGEYARTKLRNCDYLVECLLYVVRTSIEKNNIGTKIVENCVCILRNLSYRCQEVEDPNYDKVAIPPTTLSSSKSENLGCFGSSKRKKEQALCESKESLSNSSVTSLNSLPKNLSTKGYEQLWQSDVVHYYLALLQSCSNPETLEAAAGAIQNLSACYWQPSIDIRAAVRKEKGLPILVELLRMEVDRVVCAVATALRNLAIDQRNKELIGKYAMRDLIQKLPSGIPQHDMGTSDETIAAVLATINEVIKKNPEFARTLLDSDGVERLLNISKQRMRYTPCVLKFSDQVLFTMWQHNELRDVFKKHGWKEQDFITKTIAARMTASNSPNNANNTLNRPMASQSRTRYEDKTMHTRARYNADNNSASRNNGKIPNSNDSTTLYQRINTDDVVVGTGTLESPTQM